MEQNQNKSHGLDSLVRKAIRRDDIAFGQIYDLYFEKVYRFVFYRVNHRQAAEDLVAEVFIKAWNKITEIAEPKSFNGWIYQIARNLVIDYYRSRKEDVDLSLLENVLEYEDNILDKANFTFQQKAFLESLKKLSAEQQLVIKLKFIEELDNPEIAELLNKSEGAIRVIQHRAIQELKNLLNEEPLS